MPPNPARRVIPVARFADMLLSPGTAFEFNGRRDVYPNIELIYWAGGNPFHHHQDLNRLHRAWQKPETIVVHDTRAVVFGGGGLPPRLIETLASCCLLSMGLVTGWHDSGNLHVAGGGPGGGTQPCDWYCDRRSLIIRVAKSVYAMALRSASTQIHLERCVAAP